MTRETKVGLIVGLAFIMVFAVILSHKGAQPRAADTSELGPLVDASAGAADRPATSNDARRKGGGATNPRGDRRISSAVTPVPLPELPSATPGQASREPERLSPGLEFWLEGSPKTALDTEPPKATAQQRTAPPNTPPAAPPAPPDRGDSPSPAPSSGAGDPGAEPKPRVKQEYIVGLHDTITRIAQNVWGRSGPKEVNAILAANKKQVPSATRLRPGVKLVIPNLPRDQFVEDDFPPRPRRVAGSSADTAQPQNKEPSTTITNLPEMKAPKDGAEPPKTGKDSKSSLETKPPGKDGKAPKGSKEAKEGGTAPEKTDSWYTVQQDESFAAIARKRLGSADLWPEVAKLNKDKYPDPRKVPAGAKIKLPTKAGSSGASGSAGASGIGGLSKL